MRAARVEHVVVLLVVTDLNGLTKRVAALGKTSGELVVAVAHDGALLQRDARRCAVVTAAFEVVANVNILTACSQLLGGSQRDAVCVMAGHDVAEFMGI